MEFFKRFKLKWENTVKESHYFAILPILVIGWSTRELDFYCGWLAWMGGFEYTHPKKSQGGS